MSETLNIILGACLLAAVFVLTRYIVAWKFQQASRSIIRQLEAKGAMNPASAVDLPYRTPNSLRIGLRDYHAKSLECMVGEGIIGKTETGRYYLRIGSAQPGQ